MADQPVRGTGCGCREARRHRGPANLDRRAIAPGRDQAWFWRSGRHCCLFNGIGANWELAKPFLEALTHTTRDHLRRARGRRLSRAVASIPAIDAGAACRRSGCRARIQRDRCGRCLLGRRRRAAICASISEIVPAAGPGSDLAGRDHGARRPFGAVENGDPAALHRQGLHEQSCSGNLRRRFSQKSHH